MNLDDYLPDLNDITPDEWLYISGAVLHHQMRMLAMDEPHTFIPAWDKQRLILQKFQQIVSRHCERHGLGKEQK